MRRRLAIPLVLFAAGLALVVVPALRGDAQQAPGPPEVVDLPLAAQGGQAQPPPQESAPPDTVPESTVPDTTAPPPETAPPVDESATATAGWQQDVAVDANLVAIKWVGDPATEFTIEVQRETGAWEPAGGIGQHDNGPDPGTPEGDAAARPSPNVSEPLWTDDAVAVRVTLTAGLATDVTLTAIDSPPVFVPPPGDSQQASVLASGLFVAAAASFAVAFVSGRRRLLALLLLAVIVATGCAPKGPPPAPPIPDSIVSRHYWGWDLPWNTGGHECGQSSPTIHSGIGFAVMHHTVNSNVYSPDQSLQIVRGIWAHHALNNGWCDIGYNFLIDRYGQIFEGRMGGWDKAVVGAHAVGFNTGGVGIAFIGDHRYEYPSSAAHGSIIGLIAWKFRVHGTDPTPWNSIIGHRDVYATECPGNLAYDLLPSIRTAVQQQV